MSDKKSTGSITSRAMLAKLSITLWNGRTNSAEANAVVATAYQSQEGQTNVTKTLIDPKALTEVRSAATAARKLFYEYTTPWADQGARALLTKKFAEFDQQISQHRTQFETARNNFLADYPRHVTAARQNLGSLFMQGEYPDTNEINEKFTFEIIYEPMANPNDWRLNLDDATAQRLTEDARKYHADLIGKAQADSIQRVIRVVQHMAQKLNDLNTGADDGSARNFFKNSLVENVAEIAAALPGLNIAGAPEIDAMAQEIIDKLTIIPVEILRQNEGIRQSVASEAAEIAERMKGFL